MSAEIKELKTIYYNKDEAFITRGYRNQLSPPETVCYVNESFHKTLI